MSNFPKPRTRGEWVEEVVGTWYPWLDNVAIGQTVLANGTHWVKIHDRLWDSGLNRLSTHLLLRLADHFEIVEEGTVDVTPAHTLRDIASVVAVLPVYGSTIQLVKNSTSRKTSHAFHKRGKLTDRQPDTERQ